MRNCLGLLLLWAGVAHGVGYNGSVCTGSINFDLQSGINWDVFDDYVRQLLDGVPGWAPFQCRKALQTVDCLTVYVSSAVSNNTYCQSACSSQLEACKPFFNRIDDFPGGRDLVDSYQSACATLSNTECTSGGPLVEAAVAEESCPKVCSLRDQIVASPRGALRAEVVRSLPPLLLSTVHAATRCAAKR